MGFLSGKVKEIILDSLADSDIKKEVDRCAKEAVIRLLEGIVKDLKK